MNIYLDYNGLKRPPPGAFQAILTLRQLTRIHRRAVSHLLSGILQPGFFAVGAAIESTMTFVVRQIKIIRIVQSDPAALLTLRVIPADKIDRILVPVSTGPGVATVSLIFIPGFTFYLGITKCIAFAWTGNKPKNSGAFGARIVHKPGFLIHDGHHDRNTRTPPLFGLARMFIPVTLLVKDIADIVGFCR